MAIKVNWKVISSKTKITKEKIKETISFIWEEVWWIWDKPEYKLYEGIIKENPIDDKIKVLVGKVIMEVNIYKLRWNKRLWLMNMTHG